MKTERNQPLSRWIDFHLSTLFYAINCKVCFRLCQRLVWIIHPHQARKPHLKYFKRACFFFSFLNSDFLSSGPVLFHPGPSHSTKWGILSVFFLIPPRRYWFVIFCLEIKKKSCVLMVVNVLFSTAMQVAFQGKQSSFASILVL